MTTEKDFFKQTVEKMKKAAKIFFELYPALNEVYFNEYLNSSSFPKRGYLKFTR